MKLGRRAAVTVLSPFKGDRILENTMNKTHGKRPALAGLAVALSLAAMPVTAAMNPKVGGAPMYAIAENAPNAPNLTTLVAAVKAAGLVDTLASPGPFTVFAPVNSAFAKLPKGTVETLLKPENVDKLKAILTYHVVSGSLTASDLLAQVKDGGGKAELKTVEGETLTVMKHGKGLSVTDAKGDVADVTTANVMQSNGVVHVIDKVLLPAS